MNHLETTLDNIITHLTQNTAQQRQILRKVNTDKLNTNTKEKKMQKKYTRKQITEAIAYWTKQLKKMNESNLVKPSFAYTAKPIALQQLIDKLDATRNTNYDLNSFEVQIAYDARSSRPVTTLAKVSNDEYVLMSLDIDVEAAIDAYNDDDYMNEIKAENKYPNELKDYPNVVLGKMTEYDRIMRSSHEIMSDYVLTLGDICKYVKPTDKIYLGLLDNVFSDDDTTYAATIDVAKSFASKQTGQIMLWADVDSQTGELWN